MSARFRIRLGLDIPIGGKPEQSIHPGPALQHLALSGLDYPGLKPRLLVKVGDRVGLGQPLFVDKRDPAVPYVAPSQGTVVAINRGARRALETIIIRLGDCDLPGLGFEPMADPEIKQMDRQNAALRLQQSGLWTSFRTRPFSQVPKSDSTPRSVFVTAIDSAPLAADPQIVIRQEEKAFVSGLLAVSLLTKGPVYLCTATGWQISLPDIEGMKRVEFSGPHPAGLVGTHIHLLDPVAADRTVWHIGYQDVIAIGKLFGNGIIDSGRVLALAGNCVIKPRLLLSKLGASTDELTQDELLNSDSCRVISGSVLSGHTASKQRAYLGRYHNQVSVIREGGGKSLFAWLGRKQKAVFTSSQNGRFSGMLPVPAFDRVMPLDILPSPLLRALMVKDTDQAQALGCLELDEEDLALCSFVCPAKSDYGPALRVNLQQIEKEG